MAADAAIAHRGSPELAADAARTESPAPPAAPPAAPAVVIVPRDASGPRSGAPAGPGEPPRRPTPRARGVAVLPRTGEPVAPVPGSDASLSSPTAALPDALAGHEPVPAAPLVPQARLDAAPGAAPEVTREVAPEVAIEPPAVGHVIVRNDIWCNVWIDRIDRGNRRNEPLEVAAGHHVVRCVNPAGEWTQETEVAPGTTRTLTGTLLRELTVVIAVDATINGRYYARGTVAKLRPGNVEVIAGGKKQFITFRASCTLRDAPELGCYL